MSIVTVIGQFVKNLLPYILNFGQQLLDKLKNSPSLDENATVMDVDQIGNAISELRAEVLQRSQPMIDKSNVAIKNYVEEQLFSLEANAALLAKYEISSRSTERQLEGIQQRLAVFWTDALNRRISLDDDRCRSILMLPSGAKKQADLEQFIGEVLEDTFEEYAALVRSELSELYVDLEDNVLRSILRLEREIKDYDELVRAIDAKDDERSEQLLARAALKIECFDAVIGKVGA